MPEDAALTLLLGPALLVQGRLVRARVPKLPEPPGARSGQRGEGPRLRVLVLGDSSAAGVGVAHQDEALLGQLVARLGARFCVSFRLQARTGATTADCIEMLEDLDERRFDLVVTGLGVNDVTSLQSLEQWSEQQRRLHDLIVRRFSPSQVVISGLPPVHAFPALPQPLRWYLGRRATRRDRRLRHLLRGRAGLTYLSLRFTNDASVMASDGFHPGAEMYSEWGQRICDRVSPVLEVARNPEDLGMI